MLGDTFTLIFRDTSPKPTLAKEQFQVIELILGFNQRVEVPTRQFPQRQFTFNFH
jgi:hypothetical protein